eukprot:PITA_29673
MIIIHVKFFSNFQVGNALTHDGYDWEGNMDYAWSHGIISDETYKVILSNCDFLGNDTWDNELCKTAVDLTLANYDLVDRYSLYTPKCLTNATVGNAARTNAFKTLESERRPRRPRAMLGSTWDPCLDNYAITYYNTPAVQRALHADLGTGQDTIEWMPCNHTILNHWNWNETPYSVLPKYQKLIAAGLRIWIYKYVAGWTQEYEGLRFSTFYGAGHTVPIYDRSKALAFFRAFLLGIPLPDKR